ncbi:PREDICTED: uncharacterized protein LOC108757843 isoform X2 [Trachymyrmex cornetzi]|uniref:uncharacterized protein LOC108757843 isoform X2 n=1 Tax=Trachymyrmex cornetzi TaxID=471704 RepID=UPI00084F2889|nr:PREDICTED: uncharacterized protein LOC108757843 isoform X2 [Trachymyrmex cornetzi]
MSREDSSGEGRSQDAFSPDSPVDVPAKDPNAEIYENRGSKKIIRVLTVMAYLFSMQFLIAPAPEETKKDGNFLLQSEGNPMHKPLLMGRMAHHMYNVDDFQNKIKFDKKVELNTALLKLRHSLVDTLRAQRRHSSQETTKSSGFNNSFAEKVFNSTVSPTENTISVNRHGKSASENISEEKTYNDLPVEFVDSVSTLNVEGTSSTSKFMTIPEIKTKQRLDRDSVNVNPIIEKKNRYNKKSLDAVESYVIREFSNVTRNSEITNGSDRRVFEDESSKTTQDFLKTDRKEPMKQNETDDRRLINNDRENNSNGVQTSIILEKYVNDSIRNSQENYSSNEQIGQIARDKVSIDTSSRDSGLIDDPGFHQTSNDPTVVKSRSRIARIRNSEETQIERMTARSTTVENKQLEQIDLSITQRQKSFSEVFTEIADVRETSVELTSISTTGDYHNFTSITSEDDESVT